MLHLIQTFGEGNEVIFLKLSLANKSIMYHHRPEKVSSTELRLLWWKQQIRRHRFGSKIHLLLALSEVLTFEEL